MYVFIQKCDQYVWYILIYIHTLDLHILILMNNLFTDQCEPQITLYWCEHSTNKYIGIFKVYIDITHILLTQKLILKRGH